MHDYSFKRPLTGARPSWNRLVLPDALFEKISSNFDDIRIYGITAKRDTIEAPYFIRVKSGQNSNTNIAFKIINKTKINDSYFFTFEVPLREQINHIKLQFEQKNFDWLIHLEGSHSQNEWFTILEQNRILSIKNEHTNFQYTQLVFPDTQFRFYRIRIDSKEKPELHAAFVSQQEITPATYKNHTLKKLDVAHNKSSKQTEIDFELSMAVPVSFIHVDVSHDFDFYRPIGIMYVKDSTKTEKGWIYNYRNLTSSTINSIEKNDFTFSSTIAKKFRIVIENQDNQPLSISSISVKGFEHELVARLDGSLTYFLVYGNKSAKQAHYDLAYFIDKIPDEMNTLMIGKEELITKPEVQVKEPLFVNQAWLWVILLAIVLILGWFTLKMMNKA